jgi:type II secretory pathway pseudopilin PulG
MPTCPPPTERTGRAAFTFVEVLVALILLAITGVVLARVLQGSLRAKQIQRDQHTALKERADTLSLHLAGELDEPLVTLEPIEEDDK